MSISFYGLTADKAPIMLDIEDPAYLNMNSASGRSFLLLLGLEPGDEPSGEATMPEARRAAIKARALFAKRVGAFTNEGSDTKRPGHARFIEVGWNENSHAHHLDGFDRFLNAMAAQNAVSIYWA